MQKSEILHRQDSNDRNNDEEFDKRKPLRFALQI